MPRRSAGARPAARAPARPVQPMAAKPASHPPANVAPQPSQPSTMTAPQQPSMFAQMAATAGGVAVGSAVGHVVGEGLSSMFRGDSSASHAEPVAAAAPQPKSGTNPCAFEIEQFVKCAQDNSDISLCSGFNEAIKMCKERNGILSQ